MRVDGIAFDSPIGLEDGSHHSFVGSGSSERLSVEFELPVGDATPASVVIAENRDGLRGCFGSAFLLITEGDAAFAGAAAKQLVYQIDRQIDRQKDRMVGKIVVANIGAGGDWVKLAWAGERELDGLDAYLDPIFASFSAEAAAPAQVLPGHQRHAAGPWVLDVPAQLRGPRTFIWEDPQAELRIELSVLEDGEPEPVLEPGAAVAGGEAVGRDERPLEAGERFDLRVRSDADPNGESTLILAKRKVELTHLAPSQMGSDPLHRWVVLSASAPSSEGARLTTVIDALLASIRAEGDVIA